MALLKSEGEKSSRTLTAARIGGLLIAFMAVLALVFVAFFTFAAPEDLTGEHYKAIVEAAFLMCGDGMMWSAILGGAGAGAVGLRHYGAAERSSTEPPGGHA
jgi:hypothetical protein